MKQLDMISGIKEEKLSLTREESSGIKGLLILLIVLGHNKFFSSTFSEGTYYWLYSFHVACFFILPFLYPVHTFNWNRVKDCFARLYWPFLWSFVILAAVFAVLSSKGIMDDSNPIYVRQPSIFGFFHTLLTGNFHDIKVYCGLHYLWFLPVMFSMTLLRDIWDYSNKYIRIILLVVGAVCFVLFWVFMYGGGRPYSGEINYKIMLFSPFAILQGLGMLFIGLGSKFILDKFCSRIGKWVLLVFFVIVAVSFIVYWNNEIYGSKLWFSLLFAINPVLAFAVLYSFRTLFTGKRMLFGVGNRKIFSYLGVISMQVYILHQPINIALSTIIGKVYHKSALISLIVTYALTIIIATLIAKCIEHTFLNRYLFPRKALRLS